MDIHVEFYRPSFHGRRDDDGSVDWPPSPARLVGALMSGSYLLPPGPTRDNALAAVADIAASPPPTILAPHHHQLRIPPTYTQRSGVPERPTTKDLSGALDTSHLALATKSRVAKPQDGVGLAGTRVTYRLAVELDAEKTRALNEAASSLPYFGTSKDPADVWVATTTSEDPPVDDDLVDTWYPREDTTGPTRGWLPATIDWYEANYERTFSPDPSINQLPPIPATGFVKTLRYSRDPARARATSFPIVELSRTLPHHRIGSFLRALNDDLARHEARQLAFPLTVSLHHRADGRCLGVGLVDYPDGECDSVLSATPAEAISLVQRHVDELSPARSKRLTGRTPAALVDKTWSSPAKRWRSTTPLRAFPDERVLLHVLAEQIRHQTNAELVTLEASRVPTASDQHRWPSERYADGLDQWWVTIELNSPVVGPLILGMAREDGHGVLRPLEES